MRKMTLVAGLAVLAAACGGEKKAEEQAPAAAPVAAAAAGTTYDVKMEFDGKIYQFSPSVLSIKTGDVINFHNVAGGPHDVAFWGDSVPVGAAAVLQANMPNQMQPMVGPMLVEQDAVYTISFAGAPAGEYKFYCLPHLALGMRGTITVTP
jgi:plastocyanin